MTPSKPLSIAFRNSAPLIRFLLLLHFFVKRAVLLDGCLLIVGGKALRWSAALLSSAILRPYSRLKSKPMDEFSRIEDPKVRWWTPSLIEDVTKPVVLLDIDGVINCWPYPPAWGENGYDRTSTTGLGATTITYSPRVVEKLNTWHREGWCTIVWLTTWRSRAVLKLTPALGLDNFYVADWWPKYQTSSQPWDRRTPVLWIDDEAIDRTWIQRHNTLGIQPMFGRGGLTPKMIKVCDKFLKHPSVSTGGGRIFNQDEKWEDL